MWPEIVAAAESLGVKVAIENCPMIFSLDEWPGGVNLAYSPAIWRELFDVIPSDSFGLNFDPSHLVWQMIDYERAIYEFGDRIFHAHAKDLEVRRDGLYDHGVMSVGMGWQVPRLPVPWMMMVTTCEVPSTAKTVNVSIRICPTLRACTSALLLSSV